MATRDINVTFMLHFLIEKRLASGLKIIQQMVFSKAFCFEFLNNRSNKAQIKLPYFHLLISFCHMKSAAMTPAATANNKAECAIFCLEAVHLC